VSSPPSFTRATVAAEQDAIVAWAERFGWTFAIDPDGLVLRAGTMHPRLDRAIEVKAALAQYPALPPAWRFVTPGSDDSPASAWPAPGTMGGVSGSIFHTNPCVCAPWNRLAYQAHGGPHDDWTMTSWREITNGLSKADTLADMLDQIHQHLAVSPGMQA
jgi:hypothetical protein